MYGSIPAPASIRTSASASAQTGAPTLVRAPTGTATGISDGQYHYSDDPEDPDFAHREPNDAAIPVQPEAQVEQVDRILALNRKQRIAENKWLIATACLTAAILVVASYSAHRVYLRNQFCNNYVEVPCNVTSTLIGLQTGTRLIVTYTCPDDVLQDVMDCPQMCARPTFTTALLRQYNDNIIRLNCEESSFVYGVTFGFAFGFCGLVLTVLMYHWRKPL